MEAILFIAAEGISLGGGLVLFMLASAGIFLGYTSEEEARGAKKVIWAEWPLPGAKVAEEKEVRKAA